MSESWKETNINAGTLAAFIAGVATIVLSVAGIQWWIDDRIATRINPVETELKEVKQALSSSDYSRNRQYGEILSRFDRLFEQVD